MVLDALNQLRMNLLFKNLQFIIVVASLLVAINVSAKTNVAMDQNQIATIYTARNDESLWRLATSNALYGATVWQVANSLSAEAATIEYHGLVAKGEASQFARNTVAMEPVAQTANKALVIGVSSTLKEVPEKIKEKNKIVLGPKVDKPDSLKANPVAAPFILNNITFTGNESFSAEVLRGVIADAEGNLQHLEQLQELAARITQFYREEGYSLVRAILPAQVISQGNVTIHIIEAKYGRVHLTNNSNVNDDLLASTVASMQPGMVISNSNMYHALLLLSDVPGLVLSPTLSPGSKSGTSNVTLVVEDGKAYSGSLSLDQHGDSRTGKERIAGSAAVNNLAGHGDVLSVSGMVSGANMQFGRVAYDWLLSGNGAHLGIAYFGLNYHLGKDVESAKANGTTRMVSMWVDRPLIRGLDANVSVQLQADVNQLKDHIDSASLRTDRTISSISLTIMGDQINNYGRGGVSSWRLGLKTGILSFDDIAAKTADAGSANTVGHFKKINLNINYLQSVSARSSIYLEAKGQWASNNLDSSEKLVAGGVHAVRGYNSGSLSGDIGHVGTVEFRYYLRQAFDGRLTGSLFYDTAHIMVNNNPWEGLVDGNSSTINSVGVALDWVGSAQSSASFALAAPTASKSALVSNQTSYTIRFKMKREF